MAVIMSTDQGSAGYYPHVVLFRYTNNIENLVKYLQVNAHKKNNVTHIHNSKKGLLTHLKFIIFLYALL